MTVLRVALAQLNPTVGDLDGNVAKILHTYDLAETAGCDIVAFPELAVTGYPPEDLVLKPGFVADTEAALARIAGHTGTCTAVIGYVDADFDLFNGAAVCADGRVLGTYRKRLLPNYAVFDEARYFTPGNETDPLELYVIGGVKVGISICEDIWSPDGPLAVQANGGAELAVNINASPYHQGKAAYRERMLATRATDSHSALVYVNQVGGQDELVFDGCSLAFDADGNLLARGKQFVEDLLIVEVPISAVYRQRLLDPRGRQSQLSLPAVFVSAEPVEQVERIVNPLVDLMDPIDELYHALVLGTRDYCAKNGFGDVVIALSGGIDSTIVAVIAADAQPPHPATVRAAIVRSPFGPNGNGNGTDEVYRYVLPPGADASGRLVLTGTGQVSDVSFWDGTEWTPVKREGDEVAVPDEAVRDGVVLARTVVDEFGEPGQLPTLRADEP